jgi:hypothetical protein
MLKRLFIATALTGLIAGFSIPVMAAPGVGDKSGCRQAAKAKFPGDLKSRHAYKKECKAAWKAMAGKRGGLLRRGAAAS